MLFRSYRYRDVAERRVALDSRAAHAEFCRVGRRFGGRCSLHGWILRYLYEHQDAEIYQKDIEKYFGICRSGVTNIIQALEKKGLVCRASVESDARLKKVMLTESGRESHEKLGEIFKRMDAELEEGITEEELQAFLRVTHKVHLNLRKMRGENS